MITILRGEERPKDISALEKELSEAELKGYKIPTMNFEKSIITQEQAREALVKLNVDENSLFGQVMITYRNFPLGQGEELYPLREIFDIADNSNWEDEFPGFSNNFLQLSSIEGEGSYFYEKSSEAVYNCGWGEMKLLVEKRIKPSWKNYQNFLFWYYEINA